MGQGQGAWKQVGLGFRAPQKWSVASALCLRQRKRIRTETVRKAVQNVLDDVAKDNLGSVQCLVTCYCGRRQTGDRGCCRTCQLPPSEKECNRLYVKISFQGMYFFEEVDEQLSDALLGNITVPTMYDLSAPPGGGDSDVPLVFREGID